MGTGERKEENLEKKVVLQEEYIKSQKEVVIN